MKILQRTLQEVDESVRYGKLWLIKGVHNHLITCQRILAKNGKIARNRRGDIILGNQFITLQRKDTSQLQANEGDFCFVDNGPNPSWSLWKVVRKPFAD